MAWILLRPSNYKQVAPLVRTGGSRHTGLAALPHRNIHLQNDFVKWLFLFTGCNLFIIVHYLPVFSLFCIVTDTNFFKQFMIHISNILIAVFQNT